MVDWGEGGGRGGSREERGAFLPIADIRRIMRKAIPPNGEIDEEAAQELVPEFVPFHHPPLFGLRLA